MGWIGGAFAVVAKHHTIRFEAMWMGKEECCHIVERVWANMDNMNFHDVQGKITVQLAIIYVEPIQIWKCS